jgi:DNA-binding XRE family transcriptional regulator
MTTPGELVKRAREEKGWTQRDTATSVGVTPGFIAKIETGESLPSYSVCVGLANVLGVALDELWESVEGARRAADERRRVARGGVASGVVRTRGPVRVRGAIPTRGGTARGPAEIAKEIAADPDLLTAYRHLRAAMSEPALKSTVMTTLHAWARLVEGKEKKPGPRGR